jgi:protocatechuate 3,4-dioxygenase beta subunit
MSDQHPSRRLILAGALATAGVTIGSRMADAQLAPTPACHDGDAATLDQGPGPFYKPRSPLRVELVEPKSKARLFELSGQVLTRSCKPVERVLVDLWHSDDRGDYDNKGFRYRGHQFTDANGRFRFRTNMPEVYPGRTRHFHVKVQAANRPALNTQLYFPADAAGNAKDPLFDQRLLMKVANAGDALAGQFDFVLDLR